MIEGSLLSWTRTPISSVAKVRSSSLMIHVWKPTVDSPGSAVTGTWIRDGRPGVSIAGRAMASVVVAWSIGTMWRNDQPEGRTSVN